MSVIMLISYNLSLPSVAFTNIFYSERLYLSTRKMFSCPSADKYVCLTWRQYADSALVSRKYSDTIRSKGKGKVIPLQALCVPEGG